MSYLALYRKYRPSKFDQIFGQKYIVDILKNAVLNDKVSHAYLFAGPRGTGKTTVAKILAKVINCSNLNGIEPCDACDSCALIADKANPDIIEIDAASNNGVDEIRIIRDKVSLMPSVSKYKVYIIDEVHMLSTSAFNALLKTLEEPPAHVVFILATTELHKVPETIVSRCQCYNFERLKKDDIVDCLSYIVQNEKLNVEDEVLNLIADFSNGGMRDSISLLDKLCSCSASVDKKLFYDVVGLVDETKIKELIDEMLLGSYKNCIEIVKNMEKNGKNVKFLISQIIRYVKKLILESNPSDDNNNLFVIINEFNDLQYNLRNSIDVNLSFEVGILKIVNNIKFVSRNNQIISREIISDKEEQQVKQSENVDTVEKREKTNEQNFAKNINDNFGVIINNAFALASKDLKNDIVKKWNSFYDYVHNKEFSSVVSYLLDGTLEVAGEKDIIISVGYDSVLAGAVDNVAKVELLFNLVMGKNYNIAFVSEKEWEKLKNEYIESIKNGKKYEYKYENKENNVIIESKENDFDDVIELNNAVDDIDEKSAVGLFGSDIVEIK